MKYIRVYNYSSSPVILHGMNRDYTVEGRVDEHPMIEDIPEDEVNYINGKSNVFRTGMLRFDDSDTESMMEQLREIKWKETLMTEEDIEDAILHPTTEKLRRIVACNDRATIERYRAALVRIQNDGVYGVSTIADSVIRKRFTEITNGVAVSKITVPEGIKVVDNAAAAADYDAVKSQNEAMAEQIAEMQKQLDELRAVKEPAKTTRKTKTTKTEA